MNYDYAAMKYLHLFSPEYILFTSPKWTFNGHSTQPMTSHKLPMPGGAPPWARIGDSLPATDLPPVSS